MSIEKLDLQTPDLVNANFEKLAELFPNCVTETANGKAINFDTLKQELSHAVIEGNKERYRLEWPGKREAIVTANLPTTKTLRPVRKDSVDFDNTENIYIEGDNLEVLKLLQESYLGKIKMIYIDPPYNTGKDFVYKDNFSKDLQEELIESGQKDEYNQRLVVNPETAGRYHSDWLTMMYPRLKLARNLLSNDGVVFISIDDNEVHNLRKMCEDIFGESNFIAQITWKSTQKNDPKYVAINHEYLISFAKSTDYLPQKWRIPHPLIPEMEKFYRKIKQKHSGDLLKMEKELREELMKEKYEGVQHYKYVDNKGIYFAADISDPQRSGPKHDFVIHPLTKQLCKPPAGGYSPRETEMKRRLQNDEIHFGETHETVVCYKKYFSSAEDRLNSVYYEDGRRSSKLIRELFNGIKVFDFPKSELLISRIISFVTADNDTILDFFSGSASTAHAVMLLNSKNGSNRKHIQVQIPEATDEKSDAFKAGYKTICEIGKERIRRAAKKIKEEIGAEIDYGFRVYRLDESNMQEVYYKPQEYKQESMDLFADNVKPDRSADDLLAQVMLDWGLQLSLKIEQINIAGKQVFKVADNSLYACFDKGIDEDFAKAIAKDAPLRIVFRDNGFTNDTAKTNVKQLLKQLSPETEMKVI